MQGNGAEGDEEYMVFNHGIHRIHGMTVLLVLLFGVAVSAVAAEPGITVEARQRYPWNGLVDLHFTITGTSGTKYDTSFTAKDMVGGTNVAMKTIRKSNGVAAEEKEKLLPGTYNWVWDAAADLPDGFKCDRMTVTGTADISAFPYTVKFNANGGTGTMANQSFTYGTAKALTANVFTRTGYVFQGWATSASGGKVYNDKQKVQDLTTTSGAVVNLYAVWKAALYMVIDLSSGANSSKYPVSYLNAVPSGGWSDTYKTTKLVLRRIEPGAFMMQGKYNVTLTKPFYIGVFEVTQKQYILITGNNPSTLKGDCRPVEVDYIDIRGGAQGCNWPQSSVVDETSFLGRIQSKTGMNVDIPTEAQWEYTCRAGTHTDLYSEESVKKLGRFSDNRTDGKGGYTTGHTTVGLYLSNAWGVYDMYGNQWEWCLDYYVDPFSCSATDPKGPNKSNYGVGGYRVIRGGSHLNPSDSISSLWRMCLQQYTSTKSNYGFRLCLTIE